MKNAKGRIKPINWNRVPELEKDVWGKLTQNFWLPEKIPVSNDLPSWRNLTDEEKDVTMKVFTGLTLLDTIQGSVGMIRLIPDAENEFEEAILQNIVFMEAVHAKSYSNIFSTLSNTKDIDESFRWSEENEYLNFKADTITSIYEGNDPQKRKIASVMLESALFFSGFFWPIYLASRSKLTNTNDIIMLILRDESIHGYIIGQWFQRNLAKESEERQQELKDFTLDLLLDLYTNEMHYTESIYDSLGLSEEVKNFVRYNFNKALQNLGYDSVFSGDQVKVLPSILASMAPDGGANHDFFSGSGSSYVLATTEALDDDDWDF